MLNKLNENVEKDYIEWCDSYILNTTNWNKKSDLLKAKKLVFENFKNYNFKIKNRVFQKVKLNIIKMYE